MRTRHRLQLLSPSPTLAPPAPESPEPALHPLLTDVPKRSPWKAAFVQTDIHTAIFSVSSFFSTLPFYPSTFQHCYRINHMLFMHNTCSHPPLSSFTTGSVAKSSVAVTFKDSLIHWIFLLL